jgi:(p)ppGpp synthase/HD superfamily hydrolase
MKMSKIEILEYVKEFADQSHGKQVRKYTGERYIVHPVRVMEMTSEYQNDICAQAAALLHDVLEDTPVTPEDMAQALRQVLDEKEVSRVMKLVIELTDIFVKERYPGMNRKSRKEKETERLSHISADGQSIKYADLIDNVNDIVRQDTDFAKIYVREARKMLLVMTAGHPQLRERAVKLIDECLESLQKPADLLKDR